MADERERSNSLQKKSNVYSTALVDENDKLIDYCTLTVHKEGVTVEFSVISSGGQAFVGTQSYEDEEHWEEVLKIIRRVPSITLLENKSAKIKKIGLKLSPVNLTETQQLSFRVAYLETELKSLNEKFKKLSSGQWTPIPRTKVGNFTFTQHLQTFEIPQVVPETATQILVNTLITSKNEQLQNPIDVSVSTKLEEKEFYTQIRGWRQSLNTSVSNSQNIWLPFNPNDRKIYVESKDLQTASFPLELEIIGYKD